MLSKEEARVIGVECLLKNVRIVFTLQEMLDSFKKSTRAVLLSETVEAMSGGDTYLLKGTLYVRHDTAYGDNGNLEPVLIDDVNVSFNETSLGRVAYFPDAEH